MEPDLDSDQSKPDADGRSAEGRSVGGGDAAPRWIEPTSGARRESTAMQALRELDPPRGLPEPELTENARAVLARRYLRTLDGGRGTETPRQLFWRVARHIAEAELVFGGPDEALERATEFYTAMATLRFLPNSPTLHNAGLPGAQLSACFVLPLEAGVDGLFETLRAASAVHVSGGGTGFDFSAVPPRGTGSSEGPVAVLRAFSATLAAVRQGAFRAGANMGILRIDHPDLIEFVHAKQRLGEIENFNVSVAVTDAFLEQLDHRPDSAHLVMLGAGDGGRYELRRRGGSSWTVREVWQELVACAHANGEPGLFFVDRVAAHNPVPAVGRIRATNPCGEQPLHDNDSCNLGSIDLSKLVGDEGSGVDFDWDELRRLVRLGVRFLDNVIEVNELPLEELARMSRRTRRIGLGVMGFADALYQLRLPYDSEEACSFGGRVMGVIEEEALSESGRLGVERGSFESWRGSVYERRGQPMRNAFRTTVAPTGTLSILAGCSGGIEPLFSLAFTRQVMREGDGEPVRLREVNPVFERVARAEGFWSEELIEELARDGSVAGNSRVPELLREVFVTARDISPHWHLRMQAAFQRHCDSGISKTINFPEQASLGDVEQVFELARRIEVVGLTCYRDGSRELQPMALSSSSSVSGPFSGPSSGTGPRGTAPPAPVRCPEIMPSLRVRQPTPFGTLYIEISVDPAQDAEREVFAQLGKGGDLANSDLEAICRMLSLWLRSGGDLATALDQLGGIGATPGEAPVQGRALSLADGLAKALERYLAAKREFGLADLLLGRVPDERWSQPAPPPRPGAGPRGESCPSCGSELMHAEGCATCPSCGWARC